MPLRSEIADTLSQHSTSDRRGFVTSYQHVASPTHTLEFGNRAADKTADSHGEKDGRRVTFLAQDGSYTVLPYYMKDSDSALGKSLGTGLGALHNRLKIPGIENSKQSEDYKNRRGAVHTGIANAAFVLIEIGEITDDMQAEAADQLQAFLAMNGSVLSNTDMSTTTGNFIVATARNINTALEEIAETPR